MRTLIVYDSTHGNTKKIVDSISNVISGEVLVKHVAKVDISDIKNIDFLIVGSPTQGGLPTYAIKEFIQKIPKNGLNGVGVAAFDTRISKKDQSLGLRILLGVLGYAAGRIIESLKSKGGRVVLSPKGFIVEGREGPLRNGEVERASSWVSAIIG